MIHILYTHGSFGSSIEYIVRRFSAEFKISDSAILADGSMHGFKKEIHTTSLSDIQTLASKKYKISSVIYPTVDLSSAGTIETFKKVIGPDDKVVFITCSTVQEFMLVTLCYLNKIPRALLSPMYEKFDAQANCWNNSYTKLSDMQIWEQRELISLSRYGMMQELFTCKDYNSLPWLTLSVTEIINNFQHIPNKILSYLNLTLVDQNNLQSFISEWVQAQQIYVTKSAHLNFIGQQIIYNQPFTWEPLTLEEEALLQCYLLSEGYEIQCHGLDVFPTDARVFNSKIISTQ